MNGEKDPMEKLKEAMKNMTPQQRKEMETMMANMSKRMNQNKPPQDKNAPKVAFDKDGMNICYTAEMLNSGLGIKETQEKEKCRVYDHVVTPKLMTMKFRCKNGSSGQTEWMVIDDTHMSGWTKTTDSKGIQSQINYKAQFLNAKCD